MEALLTTAIAMLLLVIGYRVGKPEELPKWAKLHDSQKQAYARHAEKLDGYINIAKALHESKRNTTI